MVMPLGEEGDPGEHAVDPEATGLSGGFVLSHGQDDAYPDEDTVPVDEAFRLVEHIVGTGFRPADAHWVGDRRQGPSAGPDAGKWRDPVVRAVLEREWRPAS
ncbi:hypothetical protein [Streptomyces sp. YIM B13518]|uniref:hypothetical protein n=1 Tax=Streptomyces sp. YIM B13518 TaxID=3366316 RepID=UPI0036A369C1